MCDIWRVILSYRPFCTHYNIFLFFLLHAHQSYWWSVANYQHSLSFLVSILLSSVKFALTVLHVRNRFCFLLLFYFFASNGSTLRESPSKKLWYHASRPFEHCYCTKASKIQHMIFVRECDVWPWVREAFHFKIYDKR